MVVHSGSEIDKKRANANKLMGTFLYSLRKTTDYELISVQGGQKDNAITREAEAKLLIDAKELENVKAFAAELQKAWREEYTGTDEGITVLLTDEGAQEARVLHPTSREKVVFYLMNVPFGIQKMSGTISGLVETSSNIGILVTSEDEVTASSSTVRILLSAIKW